MHVCKESNVPFESGEDCSGGARTANTPILIAAPVTKQSSHGNPAREPEDHCENLNGENAKLVRGIGEAAGGDDEVCEREDGPDGAEEEVVRLARRPRAAVWAPA